MDKEVVEAIFKKKLKECMVYQHKFGEKQAQLEFKAPKQTIKSATKKQQIKKTKKRVLDVYGFESSDQPHIERWIPPTKKASDIFDKYLKKGLITDEIDYNDDDPGQVSIKFIVSTKPKQGNIRNLLKELKQAGYEIFLDHPRVDALPFWKKMYREKLINDNPDYLETWEGALGPDV